MYFRRNFKFKQMKYIVSTLLLVLFACSMNGQDETWPKLDASPMDRATYPSQLAYRNYLSEDERNDRPKMIVSYSRPSKKGRDIFGALLPFGEEWRVGANEATAITFYQNVAVNGKTLYPGTYTVSALVEKDAWTINLSTESGIWGSANRDKSKTVASFRAPVEMIEDEREELALTFQEIDDNTVHLVIEWDKHRAAMPINLNPIVFSGIDKSVMDVAHYPRRSAFNNYAKSEEEKLAPKITVQYGRPMKNDREIFGKMLPYGNVWRLGANESTEITVYEKATINGTEIARGRYALFATVHADKWDIIFSSDLPTWGAANRDESKDVATVSIPVTQDSEVLESLSMKFEEHGDAVHLIIGWDQVRAAIPFMFEK